MCLRLTELQKSNKEDKKIRAEGLDGYKDVDRVLHHYGLLFVPEIIQTELISRHYTKLLAGHFDINITKEFINWIYY